MKTKAPLKMVNAFGEVVNARHQLVRSSGIFWRTTNGKWVKKVVAIREQLLLTGEKKRMETTPTYRLVPA